MGVGTITEIKSRMEAASAGETAKVSLTSDIRRLDVDRNGTITPLDALLVINHISRERNSRKIASGEAPQTTSDTPLLTADPSFEVAEQKRKQR